MTGEIKNRLIEDINETTRLIEEYSIATSEILTTDIDETLEEILQRIGDINEAIGIQRADIDAACGECTEQESDLVHKMITGGHVPLGISQEMREIHKATVKMRSAFLAVRDKEKQAALRVDARVKELRIELENVNSDRKKMSGYSAMSGGIGGSGGSFDGRL